MEPYQKFMLEVTIARNDLLALFDYYLVGVTKRQQEDARRAFGNRLDTYTARLTAYINALPEPSNRGLDD